MSRATSSFSGKNTLAAAERAKTSDSSWSDPAVLRSYATRARHLLHVLPGESILEIAAGDGAWTAQIASVLKSDNPITGVVFTPALLKIARQRDLPNARFVDARKLGQLSDTKWDYVIGLWPVNRTTPEMLAEIKRLLKPGGQCALFESNRAQGTAGGCQTAKPQEVARQAGLSAAAWVPCPLNWAGSPIRIVRWTARALELAPGFGNIAGVRCLWGQAPGEARRSRSRALTPDRQLLASTSVVIPCHNEAATLPNLVRGLLDLYGDYIKEIVIVDDNSTDETSEVARRLSQSDCRVTVVVRRPPGGLGRALRDGYAAATGRYILSIDADFVWILSELRDMFDAIGHGADGAIGSRFSGGTVLVGYSMLKYLSNRGFHGLLRLLTGLPVRDVSNNLKLYRAEVIRGLDLRAAHFAANVETGLLPLLEGYDIREVPVSWINRNSEMGTSKFRLFAVGPEYVGALFRMLWNHRFGCTEKA